MPQKGSKIEFCDGQNQFKVPFIMYTDFELILEPILNPRVLTPRRLPSTPWHILLANVFEAFRDTCLRHYPAHFYTAPGLAWKACLKCTGIKLGLLTDPDMLLMFKHGIRGGITQAVHKYAAANNKYMGDKFDPNEDATYLQYLDANSLYGWAMSQPIPTGGFKWVDVNPNKISELSAREDKGYLLEVDVSYPQELHDEHNDLPFICERMEINRIEKLVPNL